MNFAIAPIPDQSPLQAAPIDPIMNNTINAKMCILYQAHTVTNQYKPECYI
jgi:hypothetical protein